ncbi:hypothetical protein DKP78_13455 [Enterococcus faecium]|nr:hypothetical protein DKP78_13455 [Enterococcus faecium]
MAKNTVLDFVSRTMSTLKISFKNKTDVSEWEYILNVRPNKDMSASVFWEKFFYRLLDENEVLVIFTDDNQLLIAEDFTRNEYATYEDTFENVLVKDYIFQRTFKMSDVIYLEYNNEKLDQFTKGLFKDYAELFGRILEVAMRNNQIRASVSIEGTGSVNEEEGKDGKTRTQRLQEFIDKIYHSFRTNSVAIVPKLKDVEGQLDAEFGVEETTQIALTAFFLISNDTLQLGARWINRYVRLCLSEAVKEAWALKIIAGTGNNEPIGLLKDLDGAVVSGVYPDKESAGVLTFKDSATMVKEFANLMKKMASYKHKIGNNDENATAETRVVDGKIYLIINPVNYYDIVARLTIQNANGVFVTSRSYCVC